MSELSFLSNTTYYTDKTDVNPVPLDAYGASDNGTYNKIEKYATKLGIDPRGLMRGYSWVKQNLPMIKSLYKKSVLYLPQDGFFPYNGSMKNRGFSC